MGHSYGGLSQVVATSANCSLLYTSVKPLFSGR